MAAARDWAVALENIHGAHRSRSARAGGASTDLAAIARERKLSVVDGWGNPFRITITGDDYLIQSAARDGRFQRISTEKATRTFDDDIAFVNGRFLQYPEGI